MLRRYVAVLAIALGPGLAPVAAADWPACKKVKREAVQLQQALREGRKLRGYASGQAMKRGRERRELWLRKQCRYYSGRLRDIERSMM